MRMAACQFVAGANMTLAPGRISRDTSTGPGAMRSSSGQASMQVMASHRLLNRMSCSCRMLRRSRYSQRPNETGPNKNVRLHNDCRSVPMMRRPWPDLHERHGSGMSSVNTAASVANGQSGEEAPNYTSKPYISTSGNRLRSWHVLSVCSTTTTSLPTRAAGSA